MKTPKAAIARSLAIAAAIISTASHISPVWATTEQPVTQQQYLDKADALLSSGKFQEALGLYDLAVEKDKSNYLSYFKRATTRLSLGKTVGALDDFATILEIKPDFEQALYQRARIFSKEGNLNQARAELDKFLRSNKNDINANKLKGSINAAETAINDAQKALKSKKYKVCIERANEAIDISPNFVNARITRAECHLGLGGIQDAISDFSRAANLNPNDSKMMARLARLQFFSLNNQDQAIGALKSCLHYDPEQSDCKTAFKSIKKLQKELVKARNFIEGGRWQSGANVLDPSTNPENGLVFKIETECKKLIDVGDLSETTQSRLLRDIYELLCKAYNEIPNSRKSKIYCEKLLKIDPDNVEGLIGQGDALLKEESYEDAVRIFSKAQESSDGQDRRINERLMKAQRLLKQSKSKDYYKVLNVPRDADKTQIKKAYRKLGKIYHPDKYRGDLPRGEVEKKMAAINEAYEVLSNDELRSRFDNGDDPNDPTGGRGSGGHPFFQDGGDAYQFHGFPGGGFPFGGGGPGGFQFKFNF